jgi:hypothetical protein
MADVHQLSGPEWYNRHHWPAYVQGAVLVDYLLRAYGPERFLTLYATCQRGTFARDCERILGVGLDDLDTAYQADIERSAAHERPWPQRQFERFRIGPDVDPAAWKAFLADYFAAIEVLLAPYRQVTMTTKFNYAKTDASGKTTTSEEDLRYARSEGFRSGRWTRADQSELILAHPARSFQAVRKRPPEPWEIAVSTKEEPTTTYRRLTRAIERRQFVTGLAAILLTMADEQRNRDDWSKVMVTKLEYFKDGGNPRVRVRLEDQTQGESVPWRAFTAVLSPADHFAVQSDVIELGQKATLNGEYSYDRYGGLPVLRESKSSTTGPDGASGVTKITVVDRRFGPIPESEFTRERLLEGPWIDKAVDPEEIYREPETFADWYGVALVAGAVSLVAGAATGLFQKTRGA